jgi:branched-chain amino acid transport system permease protein
MVTTTTAAAPATATAAPAPPPASFDAARALRVGAIGSLTLAFVAAIGMLETFDNRVVIVPFVSLGDVIFYTVPLVTGFLAGVVPSGSSGVSPRPGVVRALAGASLAGVVVAILPAVLVAALRSDLDLRRTFPNLSPGLERILTLEQEGAAGSLVLVLVCVGFALVGGGLLLAENRLRRAVVRAAEIVLVLSLIELIARQFLGNLGLGALHQRLYVTNSGLRWIPALVLFVLLAALTYVLAGRRASARERMLESRPERQRRSLIVLLVLAAALLVMPMLVGSIVNELFVNVGLFMLMALGLNIIVGYSGLLDLGHVTFFAVGAYGMAVLTSPASPGFAPELSWWLALPIIVAMAAAAGIFVGTPVIRLRGDYLAIVTLGFAAILERLFISDWLRPYFGGAQGIRRIPGVTVGTTTISGTDPRAMLYLTIVFVLLAVYVSWRLQGSRIGRAWAALREDETTAQAMGVDTTKAKLMAFVVGAMISSFAGALFAAKVGSVFPNSFELLVSIVILVIVIVGGMGHIPGVLLGAVVLIGILGGPRLPGLLQEFQDYKMLIYGTLLVYMMLMKPEGLLPSVRRTRELHQEEFLQDAWFDKKGHFTDDDPDVTGAEAAVVEAAGAPPADDVHDGTESR